MNVIGKQVVYVDGLGIQHTGTIIGLSADGDWYLAQSDRVEPQSPEEWHFKIHKDRIEAAIVK